MKYIALAAVGLALVVSALFFAREFYAGGKYILGENIKIFANGDCEDMDRKLILASVTARSYYESGALKQEARCENGKVEGVTKFYYESGALESEMPFNNGKIHGVYKGYYENGKIRKEIPYNNDEVDGVIKEYYDNGALKIEFFNGVEKQYWENGNLKEESPPIENGKPNGVLKRFHRNGRLQAETLYIGGKKAGDTKYYWENGDPVGE